jgi:hypothetical protein
VLAIAALAGGKTALAERVRGGLRGWLNLALLLAVGVFITGAMLRSLRDVPGARSLPAASSAAEAPAFDADPAIEGAPAAGAPAETTP